MSYGEFSPLPNHHSLTIKLIREQGESPNHWYSGTLTINKYGELEIEGNLKVEIIPDSISIPQTFVFTGTTPKLEIQKTVIEGRSMTWDGYSPNVKNDGTPTEAAVVYKHEGGWPERTYETYDQGIYTEHTFYIHTDIKVEESDEFHNKIHFSYQIEGMDNDYSAEALVTLHFEHEFNGLFYSQEIL